MMVKTMKAAICCVVLARLAMAARVNRAKATNLLAGEDSTDADVVAEESVRAKFCPAQPPSACAANCRCIQAGKFYFYKCGKIWCDDKCGGCQSHSLAEEDSTLTEEDSTDAAVVTDESHETQGEAQGACFGTDHKWYQSRDTTCAIDGFQWTCNFGHWHRGNRCCLGTDSRPYFTGWTGCRHGSKWRCNHGVWAKLGGCWSLAEVEESTDAAVGTNESDKNPTCSDYFGDVSGVVTVADPDIGVPGRTIAPDPGFDSGTYCDGNGAQRPCTYIHYAGSLGSSSSTDCQLPTPPDNCHRYHKVRYSEQCKSILSDLSLTTGSVDVALAFARDGVLKQCKDYVLSNEVYCWGPPADGAQNCECPEL